jgi:hypothetical protein
LKSNEKVVAVINEITQTEVRYKLYYYPQNPELLKSVKRIEKIVFNNGDTWYYKKELFFTQFKRNILAFHISDLIYHEFTISYEHIFKNGKLGIKIPLSVGIIPSARYRGPYVYDNILQKGNRSSLIILVLNSIWDLEQLWWNIGMALRIIIRN